MVYVISKSGKPLMPTKRHGMVRILLKEKKAKVVQNKPFTIQLLFKTTEYVEPVKLGIDSGYKYIGYSAITEKEELISGEVALLEGQKDRLEKKSTHRRNRRIRLRYREPRFDHRTRPKGWLAPSIQHKLDSHLRFIEKLKKILPISSITIEIANFDTQKLKNPEIEGKGYQEGEQLGFFNIREYVLHRDNHTCQTCEPERDESGNKGEESKHVPLQVHHIGYWKGDMSNRPANLMAICTKCHVPANHKKGKKLWGLKLVNKGFKEATFMTLIRKRVVDILNCNYTFGYITKSKRIEQKLEKTHYNDAFVIAGGKSQTRCEQIDYNQSRRNNGSLEKFYDAKYVDIRTGKKVPAAELFSGRRVRNKNLNEENLRAFRGKKTSKGRRTIRRQRYFYQPNDLVKYDNKVYSVRGTQNKGQYVALKGLKKVPNIKLLRPYMFKRGMYAI